MVFRWHSVGVSETKAARFTQVASGTTVVETVAKAGTRVEPMLRSWVLGENPLARLVTGDGNAKATGDKQWQDKTLGYDHGGDEPAV
ncbi:MAG: hypothetical protein R2688_07395 [Fimbriimonadaceae bacterium]